MIFSLGKVRINYAFEADQSLLLNLVHYGTKQKLYYLEDGLLGAILRYILII